MKITVLYFAALRELLNKSSETHVLPEAITTVAALKRYLSATHPILEGHLNSIRFAANESFVEEAYLLKENDEVALIPPVAGGC